jgi:hypothetical protein
MMGVHELLAELRKLDRADKLRAMQVLVTELASEEEALVMPVGHYEVWSPYDAPEAASALNWLLQASVCSTASGSSP